jgi:HD-GYP domain-containing protein (c-di-GMP phosphodiesterase class II)
VKRLVLLWFIASVIVGGTVLYLGIEEVDDEVVELGMTEAYSIDQNLIRKMPQHSQEVIAGLQAVVERMTSRKFVVAEIYDQNEEHLATAVRIGNNKVGEVVDSKQHQFPLDRGEHYEKFYIDDVMYIQILVPLTANGVTNGYFEGVYEVDPAELNSIMSRVYHTLLIVLMVILATFIMIYPVILYLNRQLIGFSNDLFKANIELMEVMGSAIAKRDSTTDIHNYRVTLYAVRLGEACKLTSTQISNLIAGSFLHDVGKIGIEDGILRKNGPLDETEFSRMKEHVLMGVDIITKADWLAGAREVIEFHHEKYDGSGYMRGLKGDEIPVNARIFAIADVFDALCSERPYKESLPLEQVVEMMTEQRGKHFDPMLLDKFLKMAPDLYENVSKVEYNRLIEDLSGVVSRYFFDARTQ